MYVLILIVVEERIGYRRRVYPRALGGHRLNPYCSGRKNRITWKATFTVHSPKGLNPYCSGRKNRIMTLLTCLK